MALAPACPFPVNSWNEFKYILTRPRLIIAHVINVELLLACLLWMWYSSKELSQTYSQHRKKKASLYMKIILLFLEIETAVNEHFNS